MKIQADSIQQKSGARGGGKVVTKIKVMAHFKDDEEQNGNFLGLIKAIKLPGEIKSYMMIKMARCRLRKSESIFNDFNPIFYDA